MKEPTTSAVVVSSAVKRAVNRIISEDEGMNIGSTVTRMKTPLKTKSRSADLHVARHITKNPRPLSSSITTTCTICSVLEELSSPQQWGEIVSKSSHLYIYIYMCVCIHRLIAKGQAEIVIYYGAILAPYLLV